MSARARTKSAWTPLTNEETNNKIYEERRQLANKWFEKWSDSQRREILTDLLHKSKVRQLRHVRSVIDDIAPAIHQDFTRYLPRFISLYIFSYLDPRSLCRCARVCWYWSWLTGMDELWMRKCLMLGWVLPNPTPPVEHRDAWKRHYIQNIKRLQALRPKTELETPKLDIDQLSIYSGLSSKRTPKSRGYKQPPWRGSDPNPTDTQRNNYLENNDAFLSSIQKLRQQGFYSAAVREMTRNVKNKVNTGLSRRHRSSSTPKLNDTIKTPESTKKSELKAWFASRPESVANGCGPPTSATTRRLITDDGDDGQRNETDVIHDKNVDSGFKMQPWRVMNGEDDD